MLKNVLKYLSSMFNKNKCECGNPYSCKGGTTFIGMYDTIKIDALRDKWSLQEDRVLRCKYYTDWDEADPDKIYR